MKKCRHRLWLCLPFVSVALVDVGVTLHGQEAAYWAGDYSAFNEASPIFAWALAMHPLVFVAEFAVWCLVFSLVLLVLPRLLSEIVALALVSGHTWGATTWLLWRYEVGYWLCIAFFVFTATVFIFSYRRSMMEVRHED
ncbi:MAG: hypothetical protein AAF492_04385 [Verrucomicrobiota bacterium]